MHSAITNVLFLVGAAVWRRSVDAYLLRRLAGAKVNHFFHLLALDSTQSSHLFEKSQ